MTENTFKLSETLGMDFEQIHELDMELFELSRTETWVSEVVKKYTVGCDSNIIMRGILLGRYIYENEILRMAHAADKHDEDE